MILSLALGFSMANPQFSQDNSVEAQSIEEIDSVMRDENGYYIVDDLRLTEDQYKANFGTEEEMRQAVPHNNLWAKKVFCYFLHFKNFKALVHFLFKEIIY